MTNISKRKLDSKYKKQLVTQFAQLFSSSNIKTSSNLFTDLCSESEQIMLIKRLTVILMLDKGYSRYRIAKTLLLSESTVQQIKRRYDLGEYSHIALVTKQRTFDEERFTKTIESLLRLGMPSMGKYRWKSLRK